MGNVKVRVPSGKAGEPWVVSMEAHRVRPIIPVWVEVLILLVLVGLGFGFFKAIFG